VTDRDPRLWAALSYALGLVSGLIVLSIEKSNPYVRFHAWQSVLAFSVILAVSVLLPAVPVVGDWLAVMIAFRVGVVALWIYLMVQALHGEHYRLPFLGDLADSLSSSPR